MKTYPIYKVPEKYTTFVIGRNRATNNLVLIAKCPEKYSESGLRLSKQDPNSDQVSLFAIEYSSSEQIDEFIRCLKILSNQFKKEGK